MKTFKIFENGIATIIKADNIVTMKDGSSRLYKEKRLIACIGSSASWIELEDKANESED